MILSTHTAHQAGDSAEDDAQRQTDGDPDQPDTQGNAAAENSAAEHIAPAFVRPHQIKRLT